MRAELSTTLNEDELAERVQRLVHATWPGSIVGQLVSLEGGMSSVTRSVDVALRDGTAQRLVLKIAPPGVEPVANRDVLRQARIMRLLAQISTVPVPEILFISAGEPPRVPPLYAMRYIDGDCVE